MSTSLIHSYHAHIYYDPANASKQAAADLREAIGARFPVQLGRWHDVHVGPHTRAMYQVAFATDVFPTFVPWLMLNRGDLAILVHPNTGRPRADHLRHAAWLGEVLALKGEVLPEIEDVALLSPLVPNTQPNLKPEV